MFHTFQSSAALKSPGAGEAAATGGGGAGAPEGTNNKPPVSVRSGGSRRISTSNACVECRRRKIRCDGTQPCGQCLWYQHPEACSYSKPAQRIVPSRKLVDRLQGQIDQYKLVLERLFPLKDIDALASLPREELLNLALTSPAASATSPTFSAPHTLSEPAPDSDEAESLEAALEAAPDEDPEWDEARKHQIKIQGISDDVNGLSMSVDRPSSYVGVSSITAALKVIVRIAPIARPYIDYKGNETALPSRSGTPPPELIDDKPNALPNVEVGLDLIDQYFEKVHPFLPMLDESKFRTSYRRGNLCDPPWLALLNMVFALGSLASSNARNGDHYTYFTRARRHVSLETFGSGNLEVCQTMGMMSGYYMHYLNRPNEANCLMGATLRMATGLGLHREYSSSAAEGKGNGMLGLKTDAAIAETRRRTWWSLFCLDVWASTTTSKPSLGRVCSAVTVLTPGKVMEDPMSRQNVHDLRVLPLVHNVEFCKIGTRIQDLLAASPVVRFEELAQIDNDLVSWQNNLPSILATNEPCPEFLRVPRSVMKWRYQNLRVVLHRPWLLSSALRHAPFAALSAEEKVAVGKCRVMAGQNIDDISAECTPDLISGWNAVWFCFQACMVPLISLFSDPLSMPEEVNKWKAQIERALAFFDRMLEWSVAAKKSHDAIARLYEAAKMHIESVEEQVRAQHAEYARMFETDSGAESKDNMAVQHSHNEQNYHQQRQDAFRAPLKDNGTPFNQTPYPQTHQHFTPTGVSGLNGMSQMSGVGMGIWPAPPPPPPPPPHNGGLGEQGTAGLGSLSGFWDQMMWDTGFPEMAEDPFGLNGEFNFPPASQDANGAACWELGN
ncbi:uncharacterized protein K452DRAFT_286252 [Aplosporella prunicola CBS 121167]|uniref:Zn(2)-C6 fungal-type domain-containing protein n=1 Tax=Aplosporella prunicola CBS 121167 TaxID=1176127 RepID=A0A6A6BJ37_9PEZI|nr:uncharacterized protein K452DRAFT_286252 [Aplosporella prunicola CBS 121167]KAF2143423.1 hypothetical protein K452DRAFT_286252 [Aplosporella prunicola CBS 121167]